MWTKRVTVIHVTERAKVRSPVEIKPMEYQTVMESHMQKKLGFLKKIIMAGLATALLTGLGAVTAPALDA